MTALKQSLRKNWLLILVNLGALLPFVWLAWQNSLGNLIDPVDAFTEFTGKGAIILLMLGLSCTPANTIFGFRSALKVRKTLGLYTFGYAALHLLVFIGLDYGFNLDFILQDALLKKPYIIVGFSALMILLPLAITSTKGWMKRLGRNWKRLHRLVYVAAVLAVIHFLWLVKFDLSEPLIFATILTVLLVVRIPPIRRRLSIQRRRQSSKRTTPAQMNAGGTSNMVPATVRVQSKSG